MATVEPEYKEVTYKVTLSENEFWTVLVVLGDATLASEEEALEVYRADPDLPTPPASVWVDNPYYAFQAAVAE